MVISAASPFFNLSSPSLSLSPSLFYLLIFFKIEIFFFFGGDLVGYLVIKIVSYTKSFEMLMGSSRCYPDNDNTLTATSPLPPINTLFTSLFLSGSLSLSGLRFLSYLSRVSILSFSTTIFLLHN